MRGKNPGKKNPNQLKILFGECLKSGTAQNHLHHQISKQKLELKIVYKNHAIIIAKIYSPIVCKGSNDESICFIIHLCYRYK